MTSAVILPLTLLASVLAGPQTDATANQCTAARSAPSALASADAPIFYRYAETGSDQAAQGLTLRALVNDQLLLTEQIAILHDARAGAVVELLSRAPDGVANLRRLAAEKGNSVKLELVHPDGTTRSYSFDELAEASRGLMESGALPRRVSSAVRLASQAETSATRIPCDDCYTNYDNCIWGCDGLPVCERRCERVLNRCLQNCSGGGCPTSQTVVETQVVGQQVLGSDCFETPFQPNPTRHDVWQFTVKNTRKLITYNCDGSQTVEILEVWYTTSICITAFGSVSCPNPTYWGGCTV